MNGVRWLETVLPPANGVVTVEPGSEWAWACTLERDPAFGAAASPNFLFEPQSVF